MCNMKILVSGLESGTVTVGLKLQKSSAAHANRVYSKICMYRAHSYRPFREDSS